MNYQAGFHSVCSAGCLGYNYRSAFCHSCLWFTMAWSISSICDKLPLSRRQLDSSYPESPVRSFIQKGLAETGISLKHQSHPPLTPSVLSWSQTLLPSLMIFTCCHILVFLVFFSPSLLYLCIYLFCLKVTVMQSLTAVWISETTSAKGAMAYPLLPKSNSKGIWNILPIIRLHTNVILMYSEAHYT